jgi:hypothetical protein
MGLLANLKEGTHMSSTHRKHCVIWLRLMPCLIAGLLSSCALLGGQSGDRKGLLEAAERFNKDLRWEDFRSAAAWISPSVKEAFWEEADRLQGRVRIMEFQVAEVDLLDNGHSGTVILRCRFYHKRSPLLQITTLRQQWVFSEKDYAWQVVNSDLQKLMPE